MDRRSAAWGTTALCLLAAALLIGYAPAATRGAIVGLGACGRVILPAIFPFLVLSSFVANCPAGSIAATLLRRTAARCYHLPPEAAPALLMSWMGGYPAGPRVLAELSSQGRITREDAQYGACVLVNSGPAFMAGVVGTGIFGSVWIGIFLFLCQLAAGLLSGLLMARLFHRGRVNSGASRNVRAEYPPVTTALVRAVSSAALATVNICAFVILLSAISEVLFACGFFSIFSRGIGIVSCGRISGETADCLLTGMLEICAGSARAASLPATEAAKILPFLLSFGGCSVWCQVAACLGEQGIPWGKLICSRLLHGGFTALLAAPWLSSCTAALAMSGGPVLAQSGGEMLWGCFWMLALCLMLILRCERGGEHS